MRFSILVSALLSSSLAIAYATKCTTPTVRKEWRSLGRAGQKAYIGAVKCLAALPHDPSLKPTGLTPLAPPLNPNSSRYDDVVYTHMDAVDTAHFTGRFFPWHRLFLHTMEGLLREKCGYTGYITYWDWTLDSADIKHSPIFNADPQVGLGVFPDASSNFSIVTGGLANTARVYPYPHLLQRNYTLKPFETQVFPWVFNLPNKNANDTQTAAELHKMVTSFIGNFTAFQAYVDGFRAEGLHNAAHLSLGGDMSNVSHSPNDPLFFLLHGMLDRVWAKWQAYNIANQYATGGGEVQALNDFDAFPTGVAPWVNASTVLRMSNLGPDALVRDVLNIKGGYLCYEYAT